MVFQVAAGVTLLGLVFYTVFASGRKLFDCMLKMSTRPETRAKQQADAIASETPEEM